MTELKLGSKGARVRAMQEALLAAGESLPKWGADGELGWESWNALMAFAQRRDLLARWPEAERGVGAIPQEILDALLNPIASTVPPRFVDVTAEHALTKGRPGPRAARGITGVVLHQTACHLGRRPKRWWNVACHLGISAAGDIFYVNHWSAYVWHANAANPFTLGIEIDGLFEGIEGRPRTLWGDGPADVLGAAQVAGAREGLRWLVDTARGGGCPIRTIYAHRQFSASRRSDPGSAIWREVGLWAVNALGLVADPGTTLDDGLPLPREWDPQGRVDYYGKKLPL